MRDLNNIPTPSKEGAENFLVAKAEAQGKALVVKDTYIKKAVATKVAQGLDESEAKELVISRVEDKVLLPNDTILMNSGIELSISEILNNPSKHNGEYSYDPLELDKGPSKAIINSSNPLSIFVWGFIHGGTRYEVRPDFEYIIDLAENSYDNGAKKNKRLMDNFYALCERAGLNDEDRKIIATVLKKRKITSSIHELASQKVLTSSSVQYPDMGKFGPLLTRKVK